MVSNVQCAFPNCSKPVIGQCPGYRDKCGRFYCAEHSWDKYCFECAKEKETDALIQEYSRAAADISRMTIITKPWSILFVSAVILLAWSLKNPDTANTLYMIIGLIAVVTLPFHFSDMNKARAEKIRKIGESKPHFEEFYKQWKAEKNKNNLRTALQVAGVLALISVVGAQALIQGSEYVARDQLK